MSSSSIIDWNNVIKKEAKGSNDLLYIHDILPSNLQYLTLIVTAFTISTEMYVMILLCNNPKKQD
jgi:hypothetical protein